MVYIVIGLAILVLDVLTKIWAKTELAKLDTVPVIQNVFHLTYVENKGAAFGVLQNGRIFFILVALVAAVVVLYVVLKFKNKPKVLNTGIAFLSAGALGNTIDRIWQGYVVDLFDFRLINFPVFNVADIFVCLGAGLLAIFFVFMDGKKTKEGELTENDGEG